MQSVTNDNHSENTHFENEVVDWVLCALYIILMIFPITQLVRIYWREQNTGWTIQKLFLVSTVGAALVRAVFFGICIVLKEQNYFLSLNDEPAFIILSNVPRVIFFSTYTLLILFWAEIIHRVKYHSYSFARKRTVFITLNVIIYLVQIFFWIPIFFFSSWANYAKIPLVENLFFACLSLAIAVLFIIYGGKLFLMLKGFPIESNGRKSKLFEVGSVTVICVICFLIRAGLLVFTSLDRSLDNNAFVVLVYYIIVELFPSGLVLVILSKLPPQHDLSHHHGEPPMFASSGEGYGSIDGSSSVYNSGAIGSIDNFDSYGNEWNTAKIAEGNEKSRNIQKPSGKKV